jgi:hypothetical protein
MKRVGNCDPDCPVIRICRGKDGSYDAANLRDALTADSVNKVPHGQEVLMSNCEVGGPHKKIFGALACSSEASRDLENFSFADAQTEVNASVRYSETGLDQAAIDMAFGSQLMQ